MGSIQEGTSSLGQTVAQMLPMVYQFLIAIPVALSFGNTQG